MDFVATSEPSLIGKHLKVLDPVRSHIVKGDEREHGPPIPRKSEFTASLSQADKLNPDKQDTEDARQSYTRGSPD